MAKQYRIDLIIRTDQADAAAARAVRHQQQIGAAAKKAAQDVEVAANAAAEANERAAMKSMVGLHALQAQAAKLGDHIRAAAAANIQATNPASAREMIGLYALQADGLRLQSQIQKEKAKDERRAIKDQTAGMVGLHTLQADGLRLQAGLQRDKDRAAAQAQREQMRTFVGLSQLQADGLKLQSRLAEGARREFEQSFVHINDLRSQAIGLRGDLDEAFNRNLATGLVTGIALAATAIVKSFDDINKSIYESQKFVQGYRESLRELIALKGGGATSSQVIADDLAIRARTLQTAQEAIDFQTEARGIGEAFIDKPGMPRYISEAEFDKAVEIAGAVAVAKGVDQRAAGTLMGQIPMLYKKRMTGDEVGREFARFQSVFQPGSNPSSLTRQYGDIAGYVTSGMIAPMDAAALLSAFSVTKGDKAASTLEQFIRGTVGGLDRARGTGVEGSLRQGEYLRSLRVTNQMQPEEIGRKIVADLQKQEAAAKKRGRQFNALDYLKHVGYANMHDAESLLLFKGIVEDKSLDEIFKPLAQNLPTTDAVNRMLAERQGDPGMNTRKQQLAADAANISRGAGPAEAFTHYERMAFEKLKAQGSYWATGTYEAYRDASSLNPANWPTRYLVRSEAETMMNADRMRTGARQVGNAGLDETLKGFGIGGGGGVFGDFQRMSNDVFRATPFAPLSMGHQAFDTEVSLKARGMSPMNSQLSELTDLAKKQVLLQEELVRQAKAKDKPPQPAPPPFRRP